MIPLKSRNNEKPIFFLEFGYVDSVGSPYNAQDSNCERKIFIDEDGNGLDDGEEQQANFYQALFNIMDTYPDVVNGVFLFGMMMADDNVWDSGHHIGDPGFGNLREPSIRNKLAETIVRNYYSSHEKEYD